METTKKCSKCLIIKEIKEFHIQKASEYGVSYICKACKSEYNKKLRNGDRNKYLLKAKSYREANREKINKYTRMYYNKNKEAILKSERDKYNNNENGVKDKVRIRGKQYKIKNQSIIRKKRKEYYQKNKHIIREKRRKRLQGKIKTPLEKLKHNCRIRIKQFLNSKKWRKNSSAPELLGTDFNFLMIYIESKFKKGMTWQNHGRGKDKWHLDHIIPLATAKNEEDVKALCHYTNLQPMWGIDNMRKNSKIIPTQIKLTI